MRRSKVRDSYPLSKADMTKYQRKARNMSLFQRDCAMMGIDPKTLGPQATAALEPTGYHRPMDFVGGDEQPPPPRRGFSGVNVDE